MPLYTNVHKAYVRRKRIFIDSDERDFSRSRSEFDFVIPLDNLLENVVSVELVDFSIKRDLQQTFIEETEDGYGNNIIDVYMNDIATETNPLYFTVTIPPRNYTLLTELATDIQDLLNAAVVATGDAYWIARPWLVTVNTSPISGIDTGGPDDTLLIQVFDPTADIGRFLFQSGANHRNNASVPLGYFDGVDTNVTLLYRPTGGGATTLIGNPVQNQAAKLSPFRFMDVNIQQVPELQPLARISLDEGYLLSKTEQVDARPRMMTNPIKRMDEMHVICTIGADEQKRPPLSRSRGGIDLVFDVLVIAQEERVPSWMQQEFIY